MPELINEPARETLVLGERRCTKKPSVTQLTMVENAKE
jgi:hypothetical protein